MPVFIGLVVVFLILLYKRSSEIITVNPLSGQRPSSPRPDWSAVLGAVQQAAQQAVDESAKEGTRSPRLAAPDRGRAAIRSMVKNNQFIEAIQLYRRLYGVDLATAKKAVDQLMLEQ